jgi:hypothetical protein
MDTRSLAAGASADVRIRVLKADYSNFDQSNDYSFNPSNTNYVDWIKTTGYISGALSWGAEP